MSFLEDLSLLDDLNGTKKNTIKRTMTELKTKSSSGRNETYDEDQDILSILELQNTIPFIFNESNKNVCSLVQIQPQLKNRISI